MMTEKIVFDIPTSIKQDVRALAQEQGLSVSLMAAKLLITGLNAIDGGERETDPVPIRIAVTVKEQDEQDRLIFQYARRGADVAKIKLATKLPISDIRESIARLKKRKLILSPEMSSK